MSELKSVPQSRVQLGSLRLGEYSVADFQLAYIYLDDELENSLSQSAKVIRLKKRWALDELWLQTRARYPPPSLSMCLSNLFACFVLGYEEAYTVAGLMSYARAYWRKATKKNTGGDVPCLNIHNIYASRTVVSLILSFVKYEHARPPYEHLRLQTS